MKSINTAMTKLSRLASVRGWILTVFAVIVSLLPTMAHAAGEADVVLKFSGNDKLWLYVSLGLGVLAIIFAFGIRAGVMAQSPGSEKMQEVGLAIREGALAYLRQQVQTMAIFVVLLAVGLGFLFNSAWIGITFIAGVLASYIAGYTGMLTAVNANMRTANAALTSYKKALEVSFRSGAVAGMITVGMGLVGATLILLFGGAQSMQYLVGFGFGGSLAALFMRVGGGIFTKAAAVGADLVGKVEAGIPEDDPRNPATIADNVGDNVGDCAGMAADVFESYEVTLVAAIVLGAATAAIFDQETWMRLIIFALIARGVGILASMFGILSVKGSDDIDMDPLKAIRVGFYKSAIVAFAATIALAYFMMGGNKTPIITRQLTAVQQFQQDQVRMVKDARVKIAAKQGKQPYEITAKDLIASDELKSLGLKATDEQQVTQYAQANLDTLPTVPSMAGYQKLDFNDSANPVLNYAAANPDAMDPAKAAQNPARFVSVKDAFSGNKYVVAHVHQIALTPARPAAGGQPAMPEQKQEQEFSAGPVKEDDLNKLVDQIKKQLQPGNVFEVVGTPTTADLYYKKEGNVVKLAFGLNGDIFKPESVRPVSQLTYFAVAPDVMNNIVKMSSAGGAQPPVPDAQQVQIASVKAETVPWYMFAAAIGFGLLMAFAIEALTDYYVSTHKKPVQEIAGVSNAGAAPMIIQGFAYAAESSVFMVFSIVVALLAPIFFFPQALILSFYGVALVGLGLLTTTGYVLAMATFGPISDNAQGVYEMSGEGHDNEYGSKAVQRLDAAGNTTKALTKGFAIATAVVAAVALFHSYLESAHLEGIGLRLDLPEIFLGLLIGGAAPYLFSASTINAVGRSAFELINEVRRQFREDKGIMAGTSKPNYGRCVAIVTAAAQRELIGPAVLAIGLPVAVAFGFSIGKPQTIINGEAFNLTGAEALGGFLAGAILSGQLMAVLLANSGGMWDNAKKLIEDGMYGGKGSEAHKAGVVCDTVGDPFKDTAGPALNPLIKVMNLVALLFAPIYIKPYGNGTLITITLIAVGALAASIWWSKRGSMSSGMAAAQSDGHEAAVATPAAPLATGGKKKIRVEEPEGESEEV